MCGSTVCPSLACVIHLFGLKCACVINRKQNLFYRSALRRNLPKDRPTPSSISDEPGTNETYLGKIPVHFKAVYIIIKNLQMRLSFKFSWKRRSS